MLNNYNSRLLSHSTIGAHKYGNNFTNRFFHLRENVISTCIFPDLGVKIGSQSFATNFISL